MTLEKAQEIKKICENIDEIERRINLILESSYLDIYIVKGMESTTSFKAYSGHDIYNGVIHSLKSERDNLISLSTDLFEIIACLHCCINLLFIIILLY